MRGGEEEEAGEGVVAENHKGFNEKKVLISSLLLHITLIYFSVLRLTESKYVLNLL
jgi:hypothetical protein